MRKISTIIALFILVLSYTTEAQVVKDAWSVGFGFTYPKYINHNLDWTSNINYGGHVSVRRYFSEHIAIKGTARYLYLEGFYFAPGATKKTTASTTSLTGGIDVIYYFVPCEIISPYITAGFGGSLYSTKDGPNSKAIGDNQIDHFISFGFGAEYKYDENWNIVAELSLQSMADTKFDGAYGAGPAGGLIGGMFDSYAAFDLGVNYFFDKGEVSKICQLYEGLKVENPSEPVDYERIENLVKKYIPREIIKEVPAKQEGGVNNSAYGYNATDNTWILVGVNFENNSTKFTAESYPILFHSALVMLQNPEIKVEVQGYTDNIGSEKSNQTLSEKRAESVKNYLMARGVKGDRIKTVGFGESSPIADNKTADGRAMNRRIEFKVVN
ncbi:MAG: OmpA family protein [bacterium]